MSGARKKTGTATVPVSQLGDVVASLRGFGFAEDDGDGASAARRERRVPEPLPLRAQQQVRELLRDAAG